MVKFLGGDRTNTTGNPIRQFILNEEPKQNPAGGSYLEQIVFEVNYSTGQWKKLRRKLKVVGEDGKDEAPKIPPAVQPPPALPAPPTAAAEAKQ